MMANFDRFSKPPVDPSTKLGFWDKLKYILHGKCQIRTRKSLEVAFKGSRDPYDLFTTAGGFVLSFRKNVVWDINKDDNSKNYFDITADKVSWYIPNYLAGPLLAWTRSSKIQFIYQIHQMWLILALHITFKILLDKLILIMLPEYLKEMWSILVEEFISSWVST